MPPQYPIAAQGAVATPRNPLARTGCCAILRDSSARFQDRKFSAAKTRWHYTLDLTEIAFRKKTANLLIAGGAATNAQLADDPEYYRRIGKLGGGASGKGSQSRGRSKDRVAGPKYASSMTRRFSRGRACKR